ncbi:GNAT family N-acetyltransferase [Sinomonas atrocyanea]
MVRPAVPGDLAAVNAVVRAAGRPDWAAAALAPRPDRIAVVALAHGAPAVVAGPAQAEARLLGCAKTHVYPAPDRGAPAGHYLGGIVVHPAARRRGAGRALTEARLAWIWERADAAYCITNARNAASIALHVGLGFRQVASGASFQGVTFDGGRGLVLEAPRPASCAGQ